MFNISSSIQIVRDAEAVMASTTLTTDEKHLFLDALAATVVEGFQGCPTHAQIAKEAILRIKTSDQRKHNDTGSPSGQKKGRKAQGGEKSPAVAPGGTSEDAEASEGPPEGIEEQA